MKLLGRADFAYGNARLHARRDDLLRDADYERLLGADLRGLLDALDGTPYAPPSEAAQGHDGLRRLHETVTAHLSRSLEQMRSFYADRARELVDVLLARFDLHNVVAILRAHAGAQREAEAALVPVGWLAGPHAAEILHQTELAAAIDLLARSAPDPEQGTALRAAFGEYERIEDLAALERAVVADHTARVTAVLSTTGPDGDALLRLVRREIDEHNLLVALRLRDAVSAGADADTPPEATRLAGGSVAPAAFAYALESPTAAAVAGRFERSGHGRWQRPLERWAANGDLSALERELERRRHADATALFVAGDPLAIDVPIAFAAAKQAEARNLRLLGEASVRGIGSETVRQDLLWSTERYP